MIREGKSIRLTGKEQTVLTQINNGIPVQARTVEEFNRFIDERIAVLCPGDTQDERFLRGMLEHFKITE